MLKKGKIRVQYNNAQCHLGSYLINLENCCDGNRCPRGDKKQIEVFSSDHNLFRIYFD